MKVLWLDVVSQAGVRAGVRFLRSIGIALESLEDETAPIPFALWRRALSAFVEAMSIERLRGLSTPTHSACLAAWAGVLRGTQSPVQAFAQLSEHGGAVLTEPWTTERLVSSRWEGSVKAAGTDPDSDALCSAAREAELASVPTLFGLPRAHVCAEALEGRQHFVATWTTPNPLPVTVAGAAAGACILAAESTLRGASTSIPEAMGAVALGAVGGSLLGYGAKRRRLSSTQSIRIGALERAAKLRERARREPTGVETGRVVAGHYRLGRRLGVGASSAIWEANRIADSFPVAVKLLKTSAKHDARAFDRLRREARALARIAHPNVVRLEEDGQLGDGSEYLVLQRLQGETLSVVLDRMGALPLSAVRTIAEGLCDALEAVHSAGVVHRDVKPANINISWSPHGQPCVTLLDFGVAKVAWDNLELTEPGIALGTPGYMSPEQRLGRAVDGRSDLYSLGCLLFECASGAALRSLSTAAEGSTETARIRTRIQDTAIDAEWQMFFIRAVHPDPDQRFQSASNMQDALPEAEPPSSSFE